MAFESLNGILKCDYSNESYSVLNITFQLFCYYALQVAYRVNSICMYEVLGCRILLILGLVSIMSLACYVFHAVQPCRNLSHLYFWLIRSFTDPAYTCSIFVVRSLAYCLLLLDCDRSTKCC